MIRHGSLRKAICILLMTLLCLPCLSCTADKQPTGETDPSSEAPSREDTEPRDGTTAEEPTQPASDNETDPETKSQTDPAPEPQKEDHMKNYERTLSDLSAFPISFDYNGQHYLGFGDGFTVVSRTDEQEPDGIRTRLRVESTIVNAVFEINAKCYPQYGAYEYTVTLRNESNDNTNVIENLMYEVTLDGRNAVVKGIDGDAGASWYQPYEKRLSSTWYTKASTSGRPTHGVFPYFNVEHGEGGTMVALGWSGRWKASFKTDGKTTTLRAGQYNLSTYLAPGESVRMPLLAFVAYAGRDEDTAANAWRHWFIDCNMPQVGGEKLPTKLAGFSMASGSNAVKLKLLISEYYRHGIDLDTFWIDAGWYTGIAGETVGWPQTGSLLMDTSRYPARMADINQLLRAHGAGLLLWFEPEVVRLDSQAFLADTPDFAPEWLLGRVFKGSWLEGDIIDFGNPAAAEWVFDRVCKVIDDAGGLEVYRQDFNCDPAEAWDAHDGAGRTGMTENKYVVGYLNYWDKLLTRYPGMFIDSCASGGGRNDLETMRRAVPLHYSDRFDGEINAETECIKLGMVTELFKWFPYFKNWTAASDTTMYQARLNYATVFGFTYSTGSDAMWSLFSQAAKEYALIRDYYYGDYYALTPSSQQAGTCTAWEFFDPARNEGFIQVFRTNERAPDTLSLRVKGLDPDMSYTLTDTDGRISVTAPGADIMAGFKVTLPNAPDSAVILIKPAR